MRNHYRDSAKTGQYILETHSLPVPDPFSYVSVGSSYPGEEITRRFNLTHEWLSQVILYLTWRTLGFPGLVIGRVLLLTAFCGLTGWIAFRRTRQFAVSLAAALAAAAMAFYFAQSRPFLTTFVFLALTMAILEARRALWLLPAVFLIWANCHSGFILGWVMCAAYSLDALLHRNDVDRDPGVWSKANPRFARSATANYRGSDGVGPTLSRVGQAPDSHDVNSICRTGCRFVVTRATPKFIIDRQTCVSLRE